MDVKEYIGYCSLDQLERMFSKFYPDQPLDKAQEFAQRMSQKVDKISAAEVQGFFLFFKDKPDEMMRNIEQIKSA